MNRSKLPMTAKLQKKMKKELRSATLLPEPVITSKSNMPVPLVSRLEQQKKRQEKISKNIKKLVHIKKVKKTSPHSKRTTPGTVESNSTPHIVHVEGGRWIKTLEKQNKANKKILSRRLAKKRPLS